MSRLKRLFAERDSHDRCQVAPADVFRGLRGFTLIELLIVVAIIAILAAIAVPNFLEAQTRAKVARGTADMRSMATALESYRIDTSKYPPDFQFYQGFNLFNCNPQGAQLDHVFSGAPLGWLTTPVAYMTSLPENVFEYRPGFSAYDGKSIWYGYKSEKSWRCIVLPGVSAVTNVPVSLSHLWVLISVGPDGLGNAGEYAMFGQPYLNTIGAFPGLNEDGAMYDPSNGTISAGDLVRLGP